MVGESAATHAVKLRTGELPYRQACESTAAGLMALQDQMNALNELLRHPGIPLEKRFVGLENVPNVDATNAANIGSGTVDNTEFGYLNGVTSAIQTQIDGKQSTTQEGWTAASLVNSWVDGALSGDTAPGYRKDRDGNVWTRGTAKNGTTGDGTTLFTLASGYRPTSNMRFPVVAIDVTPAYLATPATLRVGTDGIVAIYAAPAGTVYVQFAFSFPTA